MGSNEKLTSRERVLKAINFQQADRVPIDLGGFQTGIHKRAYEDLIKHLGFDEEIVILDPVQQLAKPSEAVLQKFNVDTRYVCAHGPDSFKGGIEQNTRDGRGWHDLKDEFGIVWSMPDDQMLYMDISHHPLANATIKDIESYPFPDGATRHGLQVSASRLLSFAKKPIMRYAPVLAVWFTSFAGICVGLSSGSST
jgi:uroporphyrinogen decarboxylase